MYLISVRRMATVLITLVVAVFVRATLSVLKYLIIFLILIKYVYLM